MIKKIGKWLGNLGIIFILSMLGSIGGQGMKELRRFVFPAIITLYALVIVQNWWVLTIYTMAGIFSMGYGCPDIGWPDNPNVDEGSALGRLFYKLFKGNRLWTNIFTRGTIGILLSLSMLSVPLTTGKWFSYFAGSQNIIGIWALVSFRGFGETKVKIFNKEYSLLNVDLLTYSITTIGLITIINGFLK